MKTPLDAFDLSGRTAVVTGAASGIGRASAEVLAGAGARVVLADVDRDGLAETADHVERLGGEALVQPTDVSQRAEVEALVARAVEAGGSLDVMANVAGILERAPLLTLEEAQLERVLAVNLRGVLFGCQAAARAMTTRAAGSIVNVASSAAFEPYPTLGAYTIAKAGVVALTRVLALEVAGAGVRVNAVAPGMVDTPMANREAIRPDGSPDPEKREAMLAFARGRNPLGIEGQPRDVALAILYLASDAARYVTGQVLHPNGGVPMV